MKKIIATLLAMVMALALCTTAFAAEQTYDFYDAETGKNDGLAASAVLEYHKAVTTGVRSIAYYTVKDSTSVTSKLVECAAADADYIVKYAGTDKIAMYMAKTNATYNYEGKLYSDFGKNCGQYNKDTNVYADTVKFYTAVVDKKDTVKLFAAQTAGGTFLLVDGVVVEVKDLGELSAVVEQHTWVIDRTKMTAKCSSCGATAKLYEKASEVPAGATYENVAGGLFLVVDKAASTTTTTTGTSPKTFDAGIAMYVGMALTSVAGSAVVIGKKKEF